MIFDKYYRLHGVGKELVFEEIPKPQEPKHGEWKETTHATVCSNCGHNIEHRQFGAYMRYCCVCGSDNLKKGDEK